MAQGRALTLSWRKIGVARTPYQNGPVSRPAGCDLLRRRRLAPELCHGGTEYFRIGSIPDLAHATRDASFRARTHKTGGFVKLVMAAAALMAASIPAQATTVFEGQATAMVHTQDPGLVIAATPLNFGPFTLDLDPATGAIPSIWVANVFGISSPESTVNLFEDTVSYGVSVAFSFANPLGASGSPITGTTRGVYTLFTNGFGRVIWGPSQTYTFGDGGAFSVALRDTNFVIGGPVTNVAGEFRLISEAISAVPEPATWAMMLFGFGFVGVALRRRRSAVSRKLAFEV